MIVTLHTKDGVSADAIVAYAEKHGLLSKDRDNSEIIPSLLDVDVSKSENVIWVNGNDPKYPRCLVRICGLKQLKAGLPKKSVMSISTQMIDITIGLGVRHD